jgi:DedD protein
MEVTLKQRLIGAVVLIALAVIFVPMILDGSGWKKSVVSNIKVQPEPKFTFGSELPDPKQLDELPALERGNGSDAKQTMADKKSESETQSAVEQTPTPEVAKAMANHIKTDPTLGTWVVQVAAFGEKNKALVLQGKLLAGNYLAFTEKSTTENKVLYRVKVGPKLKRENAEKLRDKIKKEYGLTGSFVTNHP